MKPAFFLDFRHLNRPWELNNPDQQLSGTDSQLIEVARHFSTAPQTGKIFATVLPQGTNESVTRVDGIESAYAQARAQGCSHFVFNTNSVDPDQLRLFRTADGTGPLLVPWLQNGLSLEAMDAVANCKAVVTVVNVSSVMALPPTWHPASRKYVVVPNFVDADDWRIERQDALQKRIVYIGALKESKGFHHVSAVWPEVHRLHPEWELRVCGSPALYGVTSTLGKEGIAEADFERLILGPLGGSRESAKALKVDFLGGVDKISLRAELQAAAFVILNPNVDSAVECCSVTSLEVQSAGIAIVAGRAGGQLETVEHETGGLLSRDDEELRKFIIELISNPQKAARLAGQGQANIRAHFSRENALKRWTSLFGNDLEYLRPIPRPEYRPPYFAARKVIRALCPMPLLGLLRQIHRKFRH